MIRRSQGTPLTLGHLQPNGPILWPSPRHRYHNDHRCTLHNADQNGYLLSERRMRKGDVSNTFGSMPFDTESVHRGAILTHVPPEVCLTTNLPSVFYILLLYCFFGWGVYLVRLRRFHFSAEANNPTSSLWHLRHVRRGLDGLRRPVELVRRSCTNSLAPTRSPPSPSSHAFRPMSWGGQWT